jgi:hypothetical protein
LEESAAQRYENLAAPAEDDVAGLMNRKVDGIGQVKAVRCQSAPQTVEGEEDREAAAPLSFLEIHTLQTTEVASASTGMKTLTTPRDNKSPSYPRCLWTALS